MSRNIAALLGVLVLAAACGADDIRTMSRPGAATQILTPFYRGVNCGRTEATPNTAWLNDQPALDSAVKRMQSATLSAEALPQIDFSVFGVLQIELGQRPTAGYQLRLESGRMILDKREGLVLVAVEGPTGPAAQVITSPCLLVAVPRADYTAVRIMSSDRAFQARTTVPAR